MSETAHVDLRLNSGDAVERLQRLALSSARMQQSWQGLPANVQLAQQELLRLTRVHTRVGYLRGEERRSVRLHADYVQRHHRAVLEHAVRLREMAASHPYRFRYEMHEAAGTLDEAVAGDRGIAHYARIMGALRDSEGQREVLNHSRDFFRRQGLSDRFDFGQALGYHADRVAFGAHADGTPRSPGEWAKAGVQRVWNGARQISSLFGLFQGFQLLVHSMDAYEKKAETVQGLGARMGGRFDDVSGSLDRLRRRFSYTLAEIRPGLYEMQRLTGKAEGPAVDGGSAADAALLFARATGLDPSNVLSIYGRHLMYGRLDSDLMQRGLTYSGMTARPEPYLGMVGAAQGALGRGYFDVPGDLAVRYTALVGNAFGDAYRGPRGEAFMGRLFGGMGASGSDVLQMLKYHALEGMPEFDLGNGVKAGGSTLRGIRKALGSGNPAVLERFYRTAVEYGGTGELGRDWFEAFLPGVAPHEIDALFEAFGAAGGKVPTARQIRAAAPGLAKRAEDVEQTEHYRQQRIRTEMELGVYEQLGPTLMKTAQDAKQAATHLIEGLTGVTSMATAVRATLDDLMIHPSGGNLTRATVGMQVQQNFGWLGAIFGAGVWGGAELGTKLRNLFGGGSGATPTQGGLP